MSTPPRIPEPETSPGLAKLGKVLLWFCAIAVGLSVLVFGTCLLMFAR